MNIDLANVPPVPIQIGVAGENAFRTITFDASTWGADFPDATYTVVYKRSDGYIYPVLVNAAADAIVWSPTDTDTAVSGNGQIEVRLLDGETIGKTIIMQTYVAPSLSGDESEPSTPAPDWVNDVAADADRAEAAVEHYPKIVNGVWHVWSVDAEDFVSTGIEAQGADGVSPTVTVTAIDGGHRVTITDADGAHTFDVLDGVGGSDAVESVNGKTGVVVLDATDVHALPDSTVIPVVPQMATAADMSDWTSGKTVDAAVLKEDFTAAALELNDLSVNKADRTDIPTAVSEFTNDSGFVTAQQAAAAAPVQSVNGMTGAVVIPTGFSDAVLYTPQSLTAAQKEQARENVGAASMSDIPSLAAYRTASAQDAIDTAQDSAIAAKYTKPSGGIPDSDIASAATWNAKGTYSKPSGGIPKSDLASAVQTSLGKADTALQSAPVTSVNNKTGAVTLTASDVGALPSSTSIPTKVSDLTNDSGFQTAAQVQTAIAATAATKANSATGSNGAADKAVSIPMGHLDATSTATVMTATVDGITELRDGVCMWLLNGVVTSASGFTLNVNGLGAKPCYSSLAAASRSTTIFNANYTMLFLYNSTRVSGGCWDIVYGVDTNTTYTPVKLGFGYGTCTTAAATAAKTASISSYALTAGGIVSIKFDNDVPANATLNITSKGAKAIYHRGAAITAGVIKAGDTATFIYSTYYHLISVDRDEAGDTLPAVTASDNGKFLRVVSGVWAAATVPAAESNSF